MKGSGSRTSAIRTRRASSARRISRADSMAESGVWIPRRESTLSSAHVLIPCSFRRPLHYRAPRCAISAQSEQAELVYPAHREIRLTPQRLRGETAGLRASNDLSNDLGSQERERHQLPYVPVADRFSFGDLEERASSTSRKVVEPASSSRNCLDEHGVYWRITRPGPLVRDH